MEDIFMNFLMFFYFNNKLIFKIINDANDYKR